MFTVLFPSTEVLGYYQPPLTGLKSLSLVLAPGAL
jgi:hypothetical protein